MGLYQATIQPHHSHTHQIRAAKFLPLLCASDILWLLNLAPQLLETQSSSIGAQILHNGQYVTTCCIARQLARLRNSHNLQSPRTRLSTTSRARRTGTGTQRLPPIRHRNEKLDANMDAATASRSPRPRGTPRSRVPTLSSGETTGMRSTALPRLSYEPTAHTQLCKEPILADIPYRRSSRRARGRLAKSFSCLLAAHATRLERDTASDMTFTKKGF